MARDKEWEENAIRRVLLRGTIRELTRTAGTSCGLRAFARYLRIEAAEMKPEHHKQYPTLAANWNEQADAIDAAAEKVEEITSRPDPVALDALGL